MGAALWRARGGAGRRGRAFSGILTVCIYLNFMLFERILQLIPLCNPAINTLPPTPVFPQKETPFPCAKNPLTDDITFV